MGRSIPVNEAGTKRRDAKGVCKGLHKGLWQDSAELAEILLQFAEFPTSEIIGVGVKQHFRYQVRLCPIQENRHIRQILNGHLDRYARQSAHGPIPSRWCARERFSVKVPGRLHPG